MRDPVLVFKIDIDFMLVFDKQPSVSGASFYIQGYIFSRHTYGCCLQYDLSTKITLSDKQFSYVPQNSKILITLESIYILPKGLFSFMTTLDKNKYSVHIMQLTTLALQNLHSTVDQYFIFLCFPPNFEFSVSDVWFLVLELYSLRSEKSWQSLSFFRC